MQGLCSGMSWRGPVLAFPGALLFVERQGYISDEISLQALSGGLFREIGLQALSESSFRQIRRPPNFSFFSMS